MGLGLAFASRNFLKSTTSRFLPNCRLVGFESHEARAIRRTSSVTDTA
jgi:hypothetical protein